MNDYNHHITKIRIINGLKEAIERTEINNLVAYGVLTGGFIYHGKKARDIDVLVVLNEHAKDDLDIIEKLKNFSIEHAIIQIKNGFTPDWNFPTYFITEKQIGDVFHGRSFILSNDGNFLLKKYSPREWIKNPESDYNVILFQLISHNFDLFCGISERLEEDTRKALLIIFLYTYQVFNYKQKKAIEKINLCRDLFRSAELNYTITDKLQNFLWNIFELHNFGTFKNSSFLFNHQLIQEFQQFFLSSFHDTYNSKHILKWKDMSKNLKRLVRGEKLIEKMYNFLFHAKSREEEWCNWHSRTKQQIEQIKQGEIKPKEITDQDEIRYYKLLHNSILKMLPCDKNNITNMLEVGSGSGVLSLLLSKTLKCELVLLDNDEVAIQYASLVDRKSKKILGDAKNMPFADNTFDFIHSVGLVEHFDDMTVCRIVGEIRRVLKKGGYFYLAVPNFFSPDLLAIWSKYGKGTERCISISELSQYVKQAHFEIVENGHFRYVGSFFHKYNLTATESFLGKNGLGFLNYVFCRK